MPIGSRYPIERHSLSDLVLRTGRPARIDRYADAAGSVAAVVRQFGIHSAVSCPIAVEGRLWGYVTVSSKRPEPLPADTEARVAGFTELVATAIANTQARAELAASRARIVQSADQTRRRIQRDLHDGLQQRLVSLELELRAAQARVPTQLPELGAQLGRVAEGLGEALEELGELSRGIHPAILSEGGLGPALRALTHAAKHAHAAAARVDVRAADDRLRLSVADDGVGGADPARGSGLVGLSDRVQALCPPRSTATDRQPHRDEPPPRAYRSWNSLVSREARAFRVPAVRPCSPIGCGHGPSLSPERTIPCKPARGESPPRR
jgi:signal transduction histidine kinase